MTVPAQGSPQVWTSRAGAIQSDDEYRSAVRQAHGTARRFLSGCRCRYCDRTPNRRFRRHLLETSASAWSTSA